MTDRYHDVGEIVQNVCDFIIDGNDTAVAETDSECRAVQYSAMARQTYTWRWNELAPIFC